jgi:hypothetical protein
VSLRSLTVGVLAANLGLFAVAVLVSREPLEAFEDSGFVSIVNVAILLGAAVLAALTYHARRLAAARPPSWRAHEFFWLLTSAAFVFLAVDEFAQVHETVDLLVHERVLGISPNRFSARIDDLLIGLYAIMAVVVCWYYRGELFRFPAARRFLVVAIGLLFLDVLIDLVNHADVIRHLSPHPPVRRQLAVSIGIVEESLKVIACSLFALTFYAAWRAASTEAESQLSSLVQPQRL